MIELRYTNSNGRKNRICPVFYGTITGHEKGTIIEGEIRLPEIGALKRFEDTLGDWLWHVFFSIFCLFLLIESIFHDPGSGILFAWTILIAIYVTKFISEKGDIKYGEENKAHILDFIEYELRAMPNTNGQNSN